MKKILSTVFAIAITTVIFAQQTQTIGSYGAGLALYAKY